MINTVILDSEQYETFMSLLASMKDICNDIDIRDGIIRQRSNDKNSLFEVDLTSILSNTSIALTDLKKKLDLLKIFSGQDNITIRTNYGEENSQNHFIISDNYTAIRINQPSLEFMDNKYVPEEELARIFSFEEENLILQTNLSMVITNRIKVITSSFNTPAIQVLFEGDISSIRAINPAKDQTAAILSNIQTNIPIEGSFINITAVPFLIEHDSDMELRMYREESQNISNKLITTLGTIDIRIHTKSVPVPTNQVVED